MKKTLRYLAFLVLISLAGAVFAQNQRDWWHTFERGRQMFRQGDFGNALLAFEDARRQRRAAFDRMERDFIDLLSLPEVRRMGDSLDWVEQYIQERHYTGAADALDELYYRIPRDTFNNSVSAALAALQTLHYYPEAEFWIGETYLVEGELSLAISQFHRALNLRHLMDNPDFATELLYRIADIHRIRQEFNEMEQVLISILNTDSLWMGDSASTAERNQPGMIAAGVDGMQARGSFARQAMTRTLETNGINRFIALYRYVDNESVQAHRSLGHYYYFSGRHARAQEHLMFAFLIQNTVIIDEVIRRRFDFEFSTLEALAQEINSNRLLSEYTENIEYYQTAYYLAASLHANGRTGPAMEIWRFIAAQSRAGEWQARAVGQLRSPHIEQAIHRP